MAYLRWCPCAEDNQWVQKVMTTIYYELYFWWMADMSFIMNRTWHCLVMCVYSSTHDHLSQWCPFYFLGKHYSETCYDKEVWMMNVSFQSDRIVTCFMTIKFLSLSRMRMNCAWKPYADCGFSKTSWPNGWGNKFLNIPEWTFKESSFLNEACLSYVPEWYEITNMVSIYMWMVYTIVCYSTNK